MIVMLRIIFGCIIVVIVWEVVIMWGIIFSIVLIIMWSVVFIVVIIVWREIVKIIVIVMWGEVVIMVIMRGDR